MGEARSLARSLTGTLSARLGLNLFLFALPGLLAMLIVLGVVIDARFSRLEEQAALGHVERARAMLTLLEETAKGRVLDWAVWDESFDYVRAPSSGYEADNLNLASMRNIEVSTLSLVRFDGGLTKTIYFDLSSGHPHPAAAKAFERQVASPDFLAMMRHTPLRTGFVRVGDQLLVLAAAQILRSDGTGQAEGYIVMGREVRDKDATQALQLPARIIPADTKNPARISRSFDQMTLSEPVPGLADRPVGFVRFSIRRSLHEEGLNLLLFIGLVVASLLMALILVLNWRLRAILVRPVQAFQAHVSQITRSGDLLVFDDDGRPDELGALYREFNRMTKELQALRARVEVQSFAIGKSQSASDIMHNVRNAMSPVQAILGKLDQRLRFPAEANVLRALDELAAPGPEGRRKDLLAFVRAATTKLQADLARHQSDVREALRSVGHVEEAIAVARASGQALDAPAVCDLAPVIATSCAIARHNPSMDITVRCDVRERIRIAMPRVLLAQIVDNLLTNAVEAIAATGRSRGEIVIEASRDAEGNAASLILRDNGDGFAPERAHDLFERGLSGRNKAKGGIGLHWCANTLNAHGGSLMLRSAGPGQGATAILRLPLAATDEVEPTDLIRAA